MTLVTDCRKTYFPAGGGMRPIKEGENAVIMIAGGSGFLGYNVARSLADRGEEVLLVQRHPVHPPLLESYWEREVRQAAGDITDLSVLLGLAKAYSVESIIHAAHATAGAPKGSKYEVPLHRMHHKGQEHIFLKNFLRPSGS